MNPSTSPRDTVVRIGGAAGDGVQSTGTILARAFSRLGYHVHAYNSYQSVVRGGHVWFNIRAAEAPPKSIGDHIDVLVAIDHQTAEVHTPLLVEGGVLIYDEDKVDLSDLSLPAGVHRVPLKANAWAMEIGSKLVANMIALGAVAHAVGLSDEGVRSAIDSQFGKKGEEVLAMNYKAIAKGVEAAGAVTPLKAFDRVGEPLPLLNGNEAIALGSLAAGLGFYAAYPMTPSTGVLHYLAKVGPKQGVVVKQMEDEIAVINSVIGASYAGARSMCATSGGGLALMTEAIGFSAMAELGIVVVNAMRGGPSTGLPTKVEQADLWQMVGASQGDFPRALFAPTDVADSYEIAIQAHEIADKYQIPVFVCNDFYLAEALFTVDPSQLSTVEAIDRGDIWTEAKEGFLRYQLTENGVSPRSIPGTKGLEWIAPSDEHDEDATLISDVLAGLPNSMKVRVQQVDKRARKMDEVLTLLPAPTLEGEGDVVLVAWGSTAPILEEAREKLAAEGISTQQLTLRHIMPFHTEEVKKLLTGRKVIMVEANSSGQMEDYLRMRTGLSCDGHVRRYDGEPFTPEYIAGHLKEVLA